MVAIPLLGDVIAVLSKVADLLKDFFSKAYDIINDAFNWVWSFVNFLLSNFSFDNPRKTLLLSVIFFLLVFGIIIFFSATSITKGGVSNVGPISVDVAGGAAGQGGGGGGGADNPPPNESITSTTLSPRSVMCVADLDCEKLYGEGQNLGLKCCFADEYAGYSCAGKCLKFEGLERDACKHPNACYRSVNEDWDNFASDTANRCDNKYGVEIGGIVPTPDRYCQLRASESGAINGRSSCCLSPISLCYGYCLRSDGSYSCDDPSACYEQNQYTPIVTAAGDR